MKSWSQAWNVSRWCTALFRHQQSSWYKCNRVGDLASEAEASAIWSREAKPGTEVIIWHDQLKWVGYGDAKPSLERFELSCAARFRDQQSHTWASTSSSVFWRVTPAKSEVNQWRNGMMEGLWWPAKEAVSCERECNHVRSCGATELFRQWVKIRWLGENCL
jgi:hypothetical protein